MIIERIPTIQVSNSHLAVYTHCISDGENSKKPRKTDENLTRGIYTGQLSMKTRKEIKGRLSNYFSAVASLGSKYRKQKGMYHNIVTLTLPAKQIHSDNEIKRECLMRWLELAKAKHGITFYYWVAEKQKNGNIHFHVLSDKFMSWQWVRNAWNQRVETLGYLSRFEAEHGHKNPNSTDIEKIKNINRTSRYVTKYTTKIDQQGGIQGRLHGECDAIRSFTPIAMRMEQETTEMLNILVDSDALQRIDNPHATIYIGNIMEVTKQYLPKLFNYYTSLTEIDVLKMYVKKDAIKQKPKNAPHRALMKAKTIDEYYHMKGREN